MRRLCGAAFLNIPLPIRAGHSVPWTPKKHEVLLNLILLILILLVLILLILILLILILLILILLILILLILILPNFFILLNRVLPNRAHSPIQNLYKVVLRFGEFREREALNQGRNRILRPSNTIESLA